MENPPLVTRTITKIIPSMAPKATCVPHVATMVSRYLHQLFLPDPALFKNDISDITIPPIRII